MGSVVAERTTGWRAVPRDKVLGHGDGGSLGWLERLESTKEAARPLHGAIEMEEEQPSRSERRASGADLYLSEVGEVALMSEEADDYPRAMES